MRRIIRDSKLSFRNLDGLIILCTAFIFLAGLFFLFSASSSLSGGLARELVTRQVLWMLVGIPVAVSILFIDYRRIVDLSPFLYLLNIALLVLVLFYGNVRLGAQRWLVVGGFSFQPSEFIKIVFVLILANYIGHRKDSVENVSSIAVP
ncbi:MAG: FtsW/RodA/SpoVE family cell cycle protein, partial [Candidatus Omnitrophica bacterium]|nr:FtsW/RodA/SpoVE family cell cycle protein [Candidatus Omnitrophota bacterium]